MSEVINGLELNLGNNGGGHTATVNSILDTVTVGGNSSLGAMSGALGEKYDFSNEEMQTLLKLFIAVEETNSQDSNNVLKKSVKFRDKTSLILDSHVFAVRGISASPKDNLSFEGKIYKHSEHPDSSIDPAPALNPKKHGGLIVIGKTYSVYAGQYENEPYSLGYHRDQEEDGLCFNKDVAKEDDESKNISNYSLLYGFKLSEFKEAIELMGLTINGLPSNESTIFNTSGRASAVVSSIASSLGYYWYVNPQDASINFIDSKEASQQVVINKANQKDPNTLNASFTKSHINKVIVNSLIADYEEVGGEKINRNLDRGERDRLTNFYRVAVTKLMSEKHEEFFKVFYALWATQNLNGFSFDAVFFWLMFNSKNFREFLPVLLKIDEDDEEKIKKIKAHREKEITWSDIKGADEAAKVNKDTGFKREKAKWYDAKSQSQSTAKDEDGNTVVTQATLNKPQDLGLIEVIESFFDSMHSSLFVSPTYTEQQALKKDFDGANLQILGPFKVTDKIMDVEDLSFMRPLLEFFDEKDVTIQELLKKNNLKAEEPEDNDGLLDDKFKPGFTKEYIYIGLKQRPVVNIKFVQQDDTLKFKKWLDETNIEMFFEPAKLSDIYIGYQTIADENIRKSIASSKKLYDKVAPVTSALGVREVKDGKPIDVPENVIRVTYRNKSKAEIDAEAKDPDPNADPNADPSDNYDAKNKETGEDASADFEYQYYNIINGSTGKPLDTADLNTRNGMIGEIRAFESNINNSQPSSPQKSSSETIYGLDIPDLDDITINSLSISLAGGGGVTTTISRSTRDLIPIDDQVIVSDFYKKATNLKSTSPRTTAGQRNLFGV